MKSLHWTVPLVGTLAAVTGCGGDPYARYGAAVHDDVDAANAAAFQMTARHPRDAPGRPASLDVLTVIRNGSDSVVFVGPDGNLTNGLHMAIDEQGRILGGAVPISGTRILRMEGTDKQASN